MKSIERLLVVFGVLLAAFLASTAYQFYRSELDGTAINPVIAFTPTADVSGVISPSINPIDYIGVSTTKAIYHPGDEVRYYVTYCKYRDVAPVVTWTLLNHTTTFYTAQIRSINSTGCATMKDVPAETLPVTMDPGRYYMTAKLQYKISRFRTVEYNLATTAFEVVPNETVQTESTSTLQATK